MRTRLIALLVVASLLALSCASPTLPAATEAPATPDGSAPIGPGLTAVPPGSAIPRSAAGHWESAGVMALARPNPRAIPLGDGRVLVIGDKDTWDCVRDESALTELWDPVTGTWSAGPTLNNPRVEFAAVPLADGRALATGGVNPGTEYSSGYSYGHESYSSTYLFDPTSGAGWARGGLLGTARSDPAAAVLQDGRVLVAGGYYLPSPSARVDPAERGVLIETSIRIAGPVPLAAVPADMDNGPIVPAMATAELYDPGTDRWSATRPLAYARVGAATVTLADGRVLVVGSRDPFVEWDYMRVQVDQRAHETAELFDPRSGRFTLTQNLLPANWSPFADPLPADGSPARWSRSKTEGRS